MEIRFNINEDTEFKNEIKKLIRSELKSLVRHEVIEAAKEELKLKLNSSSLEFIIKEILKTHSKEFVRDTITGSMLNEVVQPIVSSYLKDRLDFIFKTALSDKKLVEISEQAVKNKIVDMLNKL